MSMSHICAAALRPVRRWSGALAIALPCIAMSVATHSAAQALQMSDQAATQIRALLAEKDSRNAAQRKIDSQLLYASRMARGLEAAPGVATLETDIAVDHKGMAEVDIRARVDGTVEQMVRSAGGYVTRTTAWADSIAAIRPRRTSTPSALTGGLSTVTTSTLPRCSWVTGDEEAGAAAVWAILRVVLDAVISLSKAPILESRSFLDNGICR